MVKVVINGFGRIGRLFFRQAQGESGLEVVAINDLGDLENLSYLLQYDTVYGRFEGGLKGVKTFQEKDPAKLPWKKLGVDIVVEATGVFNSYQKAKVHLQAGAKRVVITAPAKDEDGKGGKTVLSGVNEKDMASFQITSNGSCTTNAASPVIEVLRKTPGILKAVLNTTHGYTATQNLVDGSSQGSDHHSLHNRSSDCGSTGNS